jgi:hypothetical protein
MAHKVIDDYLPETVFAMLQEQMLGGDFPWYYHPGTAGEGATGLHDFQFVHIFYWRNAWQSNLSHILAPVVERIQPKALIKIKANLTTPTPQNVRGGWHQDYDFPCTTAVLYLNDNDGYTEFESGEKIESVANRFVTFDSQTNHVGVTATNVPNRALINFNYFS